MIETIQNAILTVSVNSYGAELCSIHNNKTGREYLWQADPAFWKRHSPVFSNSQRPNPVSISGQLMRPKIWRRSQLINRFNHGEVGEHIAKPVYNVAR